MNTYYKLVMYQKKDRETYFNFLEKFFEITGDCDDFHEKIF